MADQEETVEEQQEKTEDTEESGAEAEASDAETAAESTADESGGEQSQPEPEAEAESAEAEPEAAADATPDTAPEPEAETAPEPEAEVEEAPAEAPKEELTFEVLHKKTVAELRDIAQNLEHDALHGYSTMHKEHLVPALCTALGIEAHAHHEVVGINKDRVKRKIRELKVERQKALEAGDHAQLKLVRSRIKSLKRKIRRATI